MVDVVIDEDIPGPGTYGLPGPDLMGSAGPAFTMRPRLQADAAAKAKKGVPGPGVGGA